MPNTKNWVDFRHVRESVDFGEVLESYGVTLKLRNEDQHQGFCPLPSHEGQGRSPSFSAHLGKRAFHCFGCQAKGNAIDFVAMMEGLNPDHPRDIRKAALLMQERFLHGEAAPPPATEPRESKRDAPRRFSHQRKNRSHRNYRRERVQSPSEMKPEETAEAPPNRDQPDTRKRIINAPLDFELQNLDPDHPYLQSRGLTPETIREFGLGFCSRGIMANRIAIPLHNAEGQRIGYAGRIVDDGQINAENPKYRLPGTREREGAVYEFSSGAFLFNAHRLDFPMEELIVVEGFFSVFYMHQFGWKNVVALMGSTLSEQQAALICRMTHFDAQVWIMTDGDAAGIRCAHQILAAISPERFVRWAELEPGEQPHTCSENRLDELLDMPVRSSLE